MKAIIQYYTPEEIERIARGEQTIKVRKTAPKLETPFKVYVYCTKERMTRVPSMYAYLHKNEPGACAEYGTIETWGEIGDVIVNPHLASQHVSFGMHGKVIGSFVCDKVEKIMVKADCVITMGEYWKLLKIAKEACLSKQELKDYIGVGGNGYGWHITEPTLFDKPKELSEFRKVCLNGKCSDCIYEECKITRPPQSWQYVEELQ